MEFSNTFKKAYWWILLIVLTILSVWRIIIGNFLTFDLYLFVFWFIIVLFPIISEISVFGLNVKKDIESAKNELKGQLADIKNSITTNQNQNQTVHIHTTPADKKEVEQKKKEEVTEEEKSLEEISKSNLSLTTNKEAKKIGSSEKAIERSARTQLIEKLVNDYLTKLHGVDYKTQIKIADVNSDKKIITDGVVFKDGKIDEIVEIKTTSVKGLEAFYFVASRFIQKLQKMGLRNRVRFIVVSEIMNQEIAQVIQKQIQQIRFTKVIGAPVPSIRVNFFKLEGDKIEEVQCSEEG